MPSARPGTRTGSGGRASASPRTGSASAAWRRPQSSAGFIRSARVVLYHASGCHLCERALEVVREVCGDGFDLVDIGGDAALEERYRARLPVVEVDGVEAFTYFVDADALRRRLDG